MSLVTTYGETVSLERTGAGSYVNGVWTPGAAATTTLTAVVVPLSPTELKVLAEGHEDGAGIVLYTEEALNPSSESSQVSADVVVWNSRRWVVHSSEQRPQFPGLAHWKSRAIEEDVG